MVKVIQRLDFLFQYREAITIIQGSKNETQKGNIKM